MLNVVETAEHAPPELGASVLIHLNESNAVQDRDRQVQLLQRAFQLAELAEEPVKRAAQPGSAVDTRSGYLDAAYALELDKLSLQSKVVAAMMMVNKAKGRELFDQIRFPKLSPLGCNEPLAYDVAIFYQAAASVFKNGFTEKEKREGEPIRWLRQYLGPLQSHSQVVPIAQMLLGLGLSPSQLADTTQLFGSSLQELHGDERSFTTAVRSGSLDSLAGLTASLRAKDLPSFGLTQSVRTYVSRNFRECSCADILRAPADKKSLREAAKYYIDKFNERVQTIGENSPRLAIPEREFDAARLGPGPDIHYYWQSSPAKDLLSTVQRLRFGEQQTELLVSQRASSAWSAQLTDFLTQLESWQDDGWDDDFFHQKSVLYESLIDLTPSQPERLSIIGSFVKFLTQNYIERKRPIEWSLHVATLLSRFSVTSRAQERTEVVEAFLNSSDPTLNLYGHVAQMEASVVQGNP